MLNDYFNSTLVQNDFAEINAQHEKHKRGAYITKCLEKFGEKTAYRKDFRTIFSFVLLNLLAQMCACLAEQNELF